MTLLELCRLAIPHLKKPPTLNYTHKGLKYFRYTCFRENSRSSWWANSVYGSLPSWRLEDYFTEFKDVDGLDPAYYIWSQY
jgi:hypothetical protein